MTEKHYSIEAPDAVINYVTSTDFVPVVPTLLEHAEGFIKYRWQERSAFGVLIDMNADSVMITHTTDILATMFHQRNTHLPSHWRDNPEIWRTILSMACNIDLGYLQALLVLPGRVHSPINIRKVRALTQFLADLQKKD
jgi:hypothetical protein